jgi:hypothetical protein
MSTSQPQQWTQTKSDSSASFLDLKYRGESPIAIRGTVTGTLYHFSGTLPVRQVDLRDAKFLLTSRLFTITR